MSRFSGWLAGLSVAQQDAHWAADFGSTTTKILKNGKIVWRQPTCIARHRSSKTTLAVGTKAYQLLGKNSGSVEIVFPVGQGVIADMEAFVQYGTALSTELGVGFVLSSLWGKSVGALATLSQLSPVEAGAWQTAIKRIGIGKLRMLPQGTAAAQALSFGAESTTACCIVDLGGQVTEVAVVSAGEVVQAVRLPIGGVTLTEQIQEHIRIQHQVALSWHTAELLKKELVYVSGEPLKKKQSVRGKDVVTHLGKTIVVSAVELLEVTQVFAEQVIAGVGEAVSGIPTELAANCLEQGLYIVGGTAQLEGLAPYLRAQLKTEIHLPKEPATLVVRGVAQI